MNRRLCLAGALAAAAAVGACFELSGPARQLSAISPLEVAWPSVVDGDVLRDSTSTVAPLRVLAYDGDGNVVTDVTVDFIALDPGLRVDPDGVVHGESVRTTPARVVAQVRRGSEVLQTPEARIDVVPVPDSLVPASPETLPEKSFGFADPPDVTSAEPLAVTLRNRALATSDPQNSGVRSWVVRYEIVEQPAGVNGQATAFFTGAGTARVTYDTTQSSGIANRRSVILRQTALASRDGQLVVKVVATIRGVPGSPVTFVVPFRAQ